MQSNNNNNLVEIWTARAEDMNSHRDIGRFTRYVSHHNFSDFESALAAFDAQCVKSAAEDAKTMKPSAEHMVVHSSPTRPMKAR